MRSLLNTAAVVTAAIALGGCPDKRPHRVPGPQSAPAERSEARGEDTQRAARTHTHRASEISWFQGTLEEAFSRRSCREHGGLFRY